MSRIWQLRLSSAFLASALAACVPLTTAPPESASTPPAPAPTPVPIAKPAVPAVEAKPTPDLKTIPPVAAAPKPVAPSLFRTLDEYKQALARHIFSSNAGHVVAGELQPLLRAVVVLQFQIDGSGSVRNIRTLRTPESEADRLARVSLERAGSLPAPSASFLQGGMVEVTETWLFNDDGKFHLRTLGPKQRSK
jgi:periplasmic protein TonB